MPFTIVIDSREKRPYTFTEGIPTIVAKLEAGDYSIAGQELCFAIERKSIDDFVNTVIHSKERFQSELRKLSLYNRAAIVVESSWQDLLDGRYTSQAKPDAVAALALAIWAGYGIPVMFAGDRPAARDMVERMCMVYAKRIERLEERCLVVCDE